MYHTGDATKWRINAASQDSRGRIDTANKSQIYTGGSEVFVASGKRLGSQSFRFIFEIKLKPFATSNSSCQLYCRRLSFLGPGCVFSVCIYLQCLGGLLDEASFSLSLSVSMLDKRACSSDARGVTRFDDYNVRHDYATRQSEELRPSDA